MTSAAVGRSMFQAIESFIPGRGNARFGKVHDLVDSKRPLTNGGNGSGSARQLPGLSEGVGFVSTQENERPHPVRIVRGLAA